MARTARDRECGSVFSPRDVVDERIEGRVVGLDVGPSRITGPFLEKFNLTGNRPPSRSKADADPGRLGPREGRLQARIEIRGILASGIRSAGLDAGAGVPIVPTLPGDVPRAPGRVPPAGHVKDAGGIFVVE